MNDVITIEKSMIGKHILLFCPNCGTVTKFVLSKSGHYFSCSCSHIVDIEIIDPELEKEIEDVEG